MTDINDVLYRTALHEAAHAVVAHYLGLDVYSVTIDAANGEQGHCFVEMAPTIALDPSEGAAVAFAGLCIEMQRYPTVIGFGPDMQLVADLTHSEVVKGIVRPNRETRAAWQLCEQLVTDHRVVIERLALTIIELHTLRDATAIYDLIEDLAAIPEA